jgi:group I intron endonuclease
MFIVYKITNNFNKKIYIGQFSKKNKKFDTYWGSGTIITKAIKKHGRENFRKEIIEYCSSKEELNGRESFWIKELNSFRPNGYNIGTGGEGQDNFTHHPNKEQIRIKIGLKSKNRSKGKTYEERYGIEKSNEMKSNYIKLMTGKNYETRYGIKKANEMKAQRSLLNKGNKFGLKTYIFYSPCGIKHIVKTGFKDFCKENKISFDGIRRKINKNIYHKGWMVYRIPGTT